MVGVQQGHLQELQQQMAEVLSHMHTAAVSLAEYPAEGFTAS
jgi:hypothetical protein